LGPVERDRSRLTMPVPIAQFARMANAVLEIKML
jgi:hypothetical protein